MSRETLVLPLRDVPRAALVWRISAEWIAVASLTLVAILLRAQELHDIPRYADEVNEILPAFDIVRGRDFPLVSGPKHIGAFFDYMLAGAMLGFGRSPELPRTVVLVSGVATVVLAYGYARSLGGHLAGFVAATLLTVSAPHVLLSSRVAWSSSLTPLLVVGAAWSLDRALVARHPRGLLVAGLLAGLALQAHPSVVSVLPGLLLVAVARGWQLLRRPEPYLAAGCFLIGCANVLIYNWLSGGGGARSVAREYPGEAVGLWGFAANALLPWRGLSLTLASAVDPTRAATVLDPFVLLVAAVSTVGLVYVARRSSVLPLAVVVGALLTLPALHDELDPLLKARYIMPLVPLVFVAVGVLFGDILDRSSSTLAQASRRIAVLGVWTVLVSGMLLSLFRFEAAMTAANCTNAPQRSFVAELERQETPGEWILLDEGVVRSAERVGYLTILELSGARVGEARLQRGGVWDQLAERASFLTAVNDGKAMAVFERQGLPLLPQAVLQEHPAQLQPDADGRRADGGIGLYRVTATGATLLAHDADPGCGTLQVN